MKKIVVLIFTVLVIATVVYGADQQVSQNFKKLYAECARKLRVPNEPRVDIAICTAFEDGDLLYPNGEYKRDAALLRIEALISDQIKLKKALEIFNRCDNEVIAAGNVGIGKTLQLTICGLPILNLLD